MTDSICKRPVSEGHLVGLRPTLRILRFLVGCLVGFWAGAAAAQTPGAGRQGIDLLDVARVRSGVRQGTEATIWTGDKRYRDAPQLKPRTSITLADLKGPAAITLVRVAKAPGLNARLARGVVMEIYFDGAKDPAVMCPVADFFGDGCNARSMEFSTKFFEVVPFAWNAYFPMPFKTAAKIVLRNDNDDQTFWGYYVVEWQALPEWREDLGYFHATWRRKGFWLTDESREEFLHVTGKGHLLGRQFSIATDAPQYANYNFVMEGNNEVDVDGRSRALEYLGSEDSFTFSWGFQHPFIGHRAGMPLVDIDATRSPEQKKTAGTRSRLSIYRFHDHMPIRFDKELRWFIDWSNETFGRQKGWVDYATVFYWYQDSPAGFRHEPLPPVAVRCLDVLPKPEKTPDLGKILQEMPADPRLENTFSTAADVHRVRIFQCWPKLHPFWIDRPQPKGGHPGNPNPGRQGILAVHPEGDDAPALVLRKVALPAGKTPVLRLVVSGDPYEGPGRSDFLLQAGVHDGRQVHWLKEELIDAGTPPDAKNWRTLEYPLKEYAGNTVGIVVKVSYGGPKGVFNEEAFFDEISVVEGTRR